MATCTNCGGETNMPYSCTYCSGTFCSKHRLPENHDCRNIDHAQSPSKDTVTEESLRDAAQYYRGEESGTSLAWIALVCLVVLFAAVIALYVLY